ncbi:MAG: hypothetical protein AD742_19670 [Methylibium sp. NZG]|nr:MAG: hypothetical protein AD742_19670 [Methylibium sp. NZG]
MSFAQALKLAIVSATDLSRDALHVYVGLTVFLSVQWMLRGRNAAVMPVIAVLVVAIAGEAIDLKDDLTSLGFWRWKASAHDLVNTLLWPLVLAALGWFQARSGGR